MSKKPIFIDVELDFAETQLEEWRKYLEKNPVNELKDRIAYRETKTGGTIPMVVASIEVQGKFLQETLQKYLALLDTVNKLREQHQEQQEVRGGGDIPLRMRGRGL